MITCWPGWKVAACLGLLGSEFTAPPTTAATPCTSAGLTGGVCTPSIGETGPWIGKRVMGAPGAQYGGSAMGKAAIASPRATNTHSHPQHGRKEAHENL